MNFGMAAGKAETRILQKIREAIISGSTPEVVPAVAIKPLKASILGAGTGPLKGLCDIQLQKPGSAVFLPQITEGDKSDGDSDGGLSDDDNDDSDKQSGQRATDVKTDPAVAPCAGVANWQRPIKQADGEAITLYDHQLGSSDRHGDPIADVYAFIARPNNAILAVADGWNWGLKSRQAARCAVQGCVERLNKSFFSENPPVNTQQVTACIRESFDYAQELIMKHEGTTTTLCVAVICSLAKSKGEWGLCVVSVGNSSCFVWQNRASLVYEVTFSASVTKKDTLDYGGCLGPSIGDDPDLSNLVCCYTTVLDDDIVFLTTDGISNNFDPVALLEGTTEIQNVRRLVTALEGHRHLSPTLPLLTQEQREVCKLSNLSNVLQKSRSQKRSDHLSALSLKDALVEYVVEVTEAKRTFLERSWRDIDDPDLTPEERASKEREIFQLADSYPGKLDHATVVAYQVGTLSENSRYTKAKAFLFSPTQRFARKETGDDDDN